MLLRGNNRLKSITKNIVSFYMKFYYKFMKPNNANSIYYIYIYNYKLCCAWDAMFVGSKNLEDDHYIENLLKRVKCYLVGI